MRLTDRRPEKILFEDFLLPKYNKTILVVESNPEYRDSLMCFFDGQYAIKGVDDGYEGYAFATEYQPDLIISDVMAPEISGLELCELIKTNPATAHIPIVLLAGALDQQHLLEALKQGANVYLTEPFDKIQLMYTVINLLRVVSFKTTHVEISNQLDRMNDRKLLKALNILIQDNLCSNDFTVKFISQQLGMSTPVLYKKVKELTNLSVKNYVKKIRLLKSKVLLKNASSISDVAYRVGYSDRKHFSLEFRKHFGYSPTTYISKIV